MIAMVAWVLLTGAFFGGDPFEEGVRLYKEGKFKESLEAFDKAVADAGEKAIPELYYNQALAALAAGDFDRAATASERAAAREPARFARRRDFVRGNIAFTRCEALEKQLETGASLPQGPAGPASPAVNTMTANPEALDPAIQLAETARDAWIDASRGDEDWAPARRNVERALVKIDELKKRKEEAQKKKDEQEKQQENDKDKKDKDPQKKDSPESRPESQPKNQQPPESRPESQPQPDPKDSQDPQQKEGQPDPKELSQEQLQRLLDKLDEKEKQRMQLLRSKARVLRVPKDW